MRLIIIRHGEVSWNEAVDNDPPLNGAGHAQARRLGERFRGQKVDRLYCSPMARARQTADYVSGAVGLTSEVLPWLREVGCPLLTDEEVAEMEARPLERWWETLRDREEPFQAFQDRVGAGIDGLLAHLGTRLGKLSEGAAPGPEERACLVCHAGVTAVLVGHLLGTPAVPWAWYRFGMGYTGVTHVRIRPLGDSVIASLTLFNCRKHLD